MFFNSIDFAVFLPIVFVLYWFVINRNLKLQNLIIVISSYVFYGWWDWRFLSLILFSTIVDYLVGRGLSKQKEHGKRKFLLWTSIAVNIGLLGFFKYYNFFLESFVSAFSFFGKEIVGESLNIILPVGISFYTFQTLSYTIDVYKKKLEPTKDFISFAAFVSFFPQLVAGPIERAKRLLPQFYTKRILKYDNIVKGLHQILWGLFKKIVIADRLAIVVNEFYNNPTEYHGLTLVLGTVFFAFQIYCDFSGYSDIAIGTARLFGFKLMTNFKTPYFSKSIGEFWKRWHISLSTWFRDYVYIPLGGNRVIKVRWLFNIFVTFLVSGFWHGANWTFIVWGALHGFVLVVETFLSKIQKNIPSVFNIIITFSLVCFAWVFFRANSIQDAFLIIGKIMDFTSYSFSQLDFYVVPVIKGSVYAMDIFLSMLLIPVLVVLEYIFTTKVVFNNLKFKYRLPIYIIGVLSILLLGAFEKNEFIYFQF
ncbi:MAG: membrane-bound O-acyltransferase family protein [Flavobacteriales bacterium]|nr:MAG: membrane-bound O-acyltransferase family protein [Flavobacteriales bacterium]